MYSFTQLNPICYIVAGCAKGNCQIIKISFYSHEQKKQKEGKCTIKSLYKWAYLVYI